MDGFPSRRTVEESLESKLGKDFAEQLASMVNANFSHLKLSNSELDLVSSYINPNVERLDLSLNSHINVRTVRRLIAKFSRLKSVKLNGIDRAASLSNELVDGNPQLREVHADGMNAPELMAWKKSEKLTYIDLHNSAVTRGGWFGGLTFKVLKDFLTDPPAKLKEIVLPDMQFIQLRELEALAVQRNITVSTRRVFKKVEFDSQKPPYDGDTVKLDIPELGSTDGRSVSIRIRSVDCAEMNSTDSFELAMAIAARNFVTERLTKGRDIRLENVGHDKYGRRKLAEIRIDNEYLSDELIERGFAVPYDGGTKTETNWKQMFIKDQNSMMNWLRRSEDGSSLAQKLKI